MEKKVEGYKQIPISWVYKGEEDKDIERLRESVTHVAGYKGKLGLSRAPGKNLAM